LQRTGKRARKRSIESRKQLRRAFDEIACEARERRAFADRDEDRGTVRGGFMQERRLAETGRCNDERRATSSACRTIEVAGTGTAT
jgi:hypothetical protein